MGQSRKLMCVSPENLFSLFSLIVQWLIVYIAFFNFFFFNLLKSFIKKKKKL